jgi:arabinogalactan endo-1,4-beta-galactosidase
MVAKADRAVKALPAAAKKRRPRDFVVIDRSAVAQRLGGQVMRKIRRVRYTTRRLPLAVARAAAAAAAVMSVAAAGGCGVHSQLLGTISGGPLSASYFLGADITFVQADEAAGATYSDGGAPKDIFQLLRDHGFNYVRLRTFVDPRAADGYDQRDGFADLAHTVTFAQRAKAAGLGFLLNFHYSDNWADPGKQCIPVAWQGMTLAAMAAALHDYTKNAVATLAAAGARPDIVQLGNEITPGLLMHLCDASGTPTATAPVNGSAANWTNLATLLKAGAAAVREVDPTIAIMLHLDRGGDKPTDAAGTALQISIDWVTNAMNQSVDFDILGESAYQLYQGDPNSDTNTEATWSSTFAGLAAHFPNLPLIAAEYGPLQRPLNDVVFALPAQQGAGTFVWEPTHEGAWNTGHALFSASGNAYTATADLALYDAIKAAYAARL